VRKPGERTSGVKIRQDTVELWHIPSTLIEKAEIEEEGGEIKSYNKTNT